MNNSDIKLIIPRPIMPRQRLLSPRPRLPSPTSPTNQTGNRFVSLSPYSSPNMISQVTRPTYSVLASLQEMSPSSYHRSPTTTATTSYPYPKPEFHINPNKQVIKILEPIEEQKLNQGFPTLMDYIFPQGANFYTNDFQTREYYEAILVDSISVQIHHTQNMKDKTQIDYSKVKIIKVLSTEDWEGSSPPLLLRQFSIKWLEAIQDSQASKEAVTTYHHSLTAESPPRPPRSSTRVPMTNAEIEIGFKVVVEMKQN
nr:enzymatic polyprotein [Tanacetum cinerariifolium]